MGWALGDAWTAKVSQDNLGVSLPSDLDNEENIDKVKKTQFETSKALRVIDFLEYWSIFISL